MFLKILYLYFVPQNYLSELCPEKHWYNVFMRTYFHLKANYHIKLPNDSFQMTVLVSTIWRIKTVQISNLHPSSYCCCILYTIFSSCGHFPWILCSALKNHLTKTQGIHALNKLNNMLTKCICWSYRWVFISATLQFFNGKLHAAREVIQLYMLMLFFKSNTTYTFI